MVRPKEMLVLAYEQFGVPSSNVVKTILGFSVSQIAGKLRNLMYLYLLGAFTVV